MRYYLVNSKDEFILDIVRTVKEDDKTVVFEFVKRENREQSGPNNFQTKQKIYIRRHAGSYFYSEDSKTWSKIPMPYTAHSTILNKHKEFQLFRGYRPSGAISNNGKGLKSEIPGKVVSISVKEGDTVKAGQTVLILESMKMENEIKSNKDGNVSKIHVAAGQTISEGVMMMEIGPLEGDN